jgi:hypothetical protein
MILLASVNHLSTKCLTALEVGWKAPAGLKRKFSYFYPLTLSIKNNTKNIKNSSAGPNFLLDFNTVYF